MSPGAALRLLSGHVWLGGTAGCSCFELRRLQPRIGKHVVAERDSAHVDIIRCLAALTRGQVLGCA